MKKSLLVALLMCVTLAFAQPKDPCLDHLGYLPTSYNTPTTIYLNFHFFNKADGSGVYSKISQEHVDSLISGLNYIFFQLDSPTKPMPGVVFVPHTNIRFESKGVYFHANDSDYEKNDLKDSHSILCGDEYLNKYGINIKTEINIFFFKNVTHLGTGCGPWTPYPHVMMSKYHEATLNQDKHWSWATSKLLAHELGHVLIRMSHTFTAGELRSSGITDVSPQDDRGIRDCKPGNSNNLMGYNPCRSYLSPGQIGKIHYLINSGFTTPYTDLAIYNQENSLIINSQYSGHRDLVMWNNAKAIGGDLIIKNKISLEMNCALVLNDKGKIILHKGSNITLGPTAKIYRIKKGQLIAVPLDEVLKKAKVRRRG